CIPSLITPKPTLADGVIIPDPICIRCPVPPPPASDVPYLTVQSHQVNVTIDQQIATTRVDQIFRNDSQWAMEGTYLFPLPEGATINRFAMWIDGEPVEAQLYTKEEARQIYNAIVRKRLDPALLEYVGRDLFQASIFPIEPGDTRRIVIEYNQILTIDNGLVQYVYPLSTEKFSDKLLESVSVTVSIKSSQALKAIYSPSHPVHVTRDSNFVASASWETRDIRPKTDFVLYYTVSPQDIGLNLLSYRSSGEDGFFTLLVAPNIEVREVVEKDVILVLDTSGSMEGDKMMEAQNALTFVLDHLNPSDRFNVVSFSTGVRSFAPNLQHVDAVPEAKAFVQNLRSEGSTDINRALLEAIASVDTDQARPVIMIFLTDGLPTSGVTDTDLILRSLAQATMDPVRIFPFGVGDDVDTILLDSLARQHRGASAYVRPGNKVDEAISAFYEKVSTPVLADVTLTVDGTNIADTYPYPHPDIFAGTQLTIVGRYTQGGPATVILEGKVNGQHKTFQYEDFVFQVEGGSNFIPRLWATRKIGHLLNQIRLHGENKEAIGQIVSLSIRYGIITPYTSFLVEEPEEALNSAGRDRIVEREINVAAAPQLQTGALAVDAAVVNRSLEQAEIAAPPAISTDRTNTRTATSPLEPTVQIVGDKAFINRDGVWVDTSFDADLMKPRTMHFASPKLFEFLAANDNVAPYFSIGEHVIVVIEGQAYEMIPADLEMVSDNVSDRTQTGSRPNQRPTIVNLQWCDLFEGLGFTCF
ncbi:MAG: VIT domain-containing protein, partial [Chloroflexota bacterium]